MCIGRGPSTLSLDPSVKAEQEAQKAKAMEEKKTAKQDALEQTVSEMRRGRGRRSLISGSGGGMGYYNEYNQ
jgi:hypothetical protein